jgi:hypothetical protein
LTGDHYVAATYQAGVISGTAARTSSETSLRRDCLTTTASAAAGATINIYTAASSIATWSAGR